MHYGSISSPHRHEVGAMTATMRALVGGPRCLRVALVIDGRIVEEVRVRSRAGLTVGSSEHADLVLPDSRLPGRVVLFEPTDAGHRLLPPEACRGRIVVDGEPRDVGRAPIELDEGARGKLELGAAVLLFQVAHEPPVQPRAQLPRSVLEPAVRVDWFTSTIAALSFLLHFLLAGALYSDWLDPVLDESVTVNGVVEDLAALTPPPEVAVEQRAGPHTKQGPARKRHPAQKGRGSASARATSVNAASESAALGRQLARLELETLGALRSSGPATAGVLRRSEVPTAGLDAAARSAKGVGAPGAIAISGGGPIARGSNDLSAIARRNVVDVHETGRAKAVDGPKPQVGSSPPRVHGTVSDAARVVASMRAGFRACYQRAINDLPDARGRIQLSLRVGPNGEVTSVGASPSGHLPSSMVGCVRRRASMAQFGPPDGGEAVVQFPIWFLQN